MNKNYVDSVAQAEELGFISSPAIRINSRHIQLDVRESLCESCGDLCGDEVDCRVWVYQGKEYTVPPKAMLIDAILRAVDSGEKEIEPGKAPLPDNLMRYFAAMEKKEAGVKREEKSCCCSGHGSKCC